VAHQCGITLPRTEGGQYISLLDECGGHTQEYHFHERMTCLYDATGGGHSTAIGVESGITNASPANSVITSGANAGLLQLYGAYEDTDTLAAPLLD